MVGGGCYRGLRLSQKPPMSFSLKYASAVTNITSKVAFLFLTVNRSTDHRSLHNFWLQHRPQTWSLLHQDTRPRHSLGRLPRLQISNGLRWQPGLLTPIQQHGDMVAWPTDINTASGCSTDHRSLHGPG